MPNKKQKWLAVDAIDRLKAEDAERDAKRAALSNTPHIDAHHSSGDCALSPEELVARDEREAEQHAAKQAAQREPMHDLRDAITALVQDQIDDHLSTWGHIE